MKTLALTCFICAIVFVSADAVLAQTPSKPGSGGSGGGPSSPSPMYVNGSFSQSINYPGFYVSASAQNTEMTYTNEDGSTWTEYNTNGCLNASIRQGAMGYYFKPVSHRISTDSYESGQASILFHLELLVSKEPVGDWQGLPRGSMYNGLFGFSYDASSDIRHRTDWFYDEPNDSWYSVLTSDVDYNASYWMRDAETTNLSLNANQWTDKHNDQTYINIDGSYNLVWKGPADMAQEFSVQFAATPEPTTLMLLTLGGIGALARRRPR